MSCTSYATGNMVAVLHETRRIACSVHLKLLQTRSDVKYTPGRTALENFTTPLCYN